MTATNDGKIALRLPAATLDRAERVRLAIQRKSLKITFPVSEVYRRALEQGLKVLERRFRP